MQVSNHNYRQGGIVSSIWLSPDQVLEEDHIRNWGVALFFVGSLLVMGVYHIVLYLFRRSNISPLLFGLYCLLWMVCVLTSEASEWSIRILLPGLGAGLMERTSLMSFFLSVPVGFHFFITLYPKEFSRTIMRMSQALAAAFSLLAVFSSHKTLAAVVPYYYAIASALILYCLCRLYLARRRKREGSTFILLGFFALGFSGINDMLVDMGLLRSVSMISVGMFLFIMSQAFALSLRFSRAFASVERLSVELENKNTALEDEIAERAKLEREIVTVSEEERRRLSHHLHDGLCQQLTGARLRCSVLERKLGPQQTGGDEFAQLTNLLEESVNTAYDLSRGLWPVEHAGDDAHASLEELCRRFAQSSDMAVDFVEQRGCAACANPGITQLYRIAQEALANAVKHAQAKRIRVTLDCKDQTTVSLAVVDDGRGRKAAVKSQGGLGMRIMAHRAQVIGASLTISDAPGSGTRVTCVAACLHARQGPPGASQE